MADRLRPPRTSDFESYHLSTEARCQTLIYAIFALSSQLCDGYDSIGENGERVSREVDGIWNEHGTCPSLRLRECLYATQPLDTVEHVGGRLEDGEATTTHDDQYPRAYMLEHGVKQLRDEDEELVVALWQPFACFVVVECADGTVALEMFDPDDGSDPDTFTKMDIHSWLQTMFDAYCEELKEALLLTDPCVDVVGTDRSTPYEKFVPHFMIDRHTCYDCSTSGTFCTQYGQLN